MSRLGIIFFSAAITLSPLRTKGAGVIVVTKDMIHHEFKTPPFHTASDEILKILTVFPPNHEEALKNIQRDSKKGAIIETYDEAGVLTTITFNHEGVWCKGRFFKPRLGLIGLTIKNISYQTDTNKFIIRGKLGLLGKEVPMPLKNACRLVDQILHISSGKLESTEILIPDGKGAKLVLE